jgi:hypothetical protein
LHRQGEATLAPTIVRALHRQGEAPFAPTSVRGLAPTDVSPLAPTGASGTRRTLPLAAVVRDLRSGVGYLATRSSRHAGKHSDGCVRPLDARVGRASARPRSLNLADPLSRLLLSLLTLLGMPRIASLRETPGRPAVRRESFRSDTRIDFAPISDSRIAPTSVRELAPTRRSAFAPTSVRQLAPTRRSDLSTDNRQCLAPTRRSALRTDTR